MNLLLTRVGTNVSLHAPAKITLRAGALVVSLPVSWWPLAIASIVLSSRSVAKMWISESVHAGAFV